MTYELTYAARHKHRPFGTLYQGKGIIWKMHPWKGVFRPETRDKKIIQSQHEIRQNGRIKCSMNGKWQGEQRCYSLESCSFTLAMAKIQRLTQILLTCSLSLWICGLRSSYKRFAKETGKYIRGEHFTVSLYCKMFSYISITYIVLLYQYHIYQDQYHLYSSPISVSPIYQYQYHLYSSAISVSPISVSVSPI